MKMPIPLTLFNFSFITAATLDAAESWRFQFWNLAYPPIVVTAVGGNCCKLPFKIPKEDKDDKQEVMPS